MKGSTTRTLILAAILAIVVAALAYDYLVAAPGSEKAFDTLEALAAERESQGTASGGLLHSTDVQKAFGFAPTKTKVEQNYTVEWYCWWGNIPGINTWKRYVTVVYVGNEPRHYSTHFKNEPPPAEFLPTIEVYRGPPLEGAEPPGPLSLSGPPGAGKGGKSNKSSKGNEGSKSNEGDSQNDSSRSEAGDENKSDSQ